MFGNEGLASKLWYCQAWANFLVSSDNNIVTYNLRILLLMMSKANNLSLEMETVAYDNNKVLYERY